MATVSLLLVAWLYSVPPLRLKERPPLDSLANGFGYFLLPFTMGYCLNANPREMPLKYYLLALCVCGIHALATAADYDADRAAGHRTLAVKFGRRAAAAVAFATFVLALLFGDFNSVAVRVYLAVLHYRNFGRALVPTAIADNCRLYYDFCWISYWRRSVTCLDVVCRSQRLSDSVQHLTLAAIGG